MKKQYLKLNEVNLCYQESGSGVHMLFVHGWAARKECWNEVISMLQKHFHCIAVDLRGHGESELLVNAHATVERMAEDIAQVIQRLVPGKVILVTHSMGAMVALEYIKQHGCNALDGLVILDMSPKIINDNNWCYGMQGYPEEKMELNEIELKVNPSRFLYRFLRWISIKPEEFPSYFDNKVTSKIMGIRDENALLEAWKSVCAMDRRDTISKIIVPTLYLIPQKNLFPSETAYYLQTLISAPFIIRHVKGCGHMLMQDAPAETGCLIWRFYDQIIRENQKIG